MTWVVLRLFTEFRELSALTETQAASIESSEAELTSTIDALNTEIRAHESVKHELQERTVAIELERTRRISAEVMASERHAEIERLIAQNRELREDLRTITNERLKSVDALNLKLMRESVPEVAPDMEKYKLPAKDRGILGMSPAKLNLRAAGEILRKHHPSFQTRPTEEPTTTPIDEVTA